MMQPSYLDTVDTVPRHTRQLSARPHLRLVPAAGRNPGRLSAEATAGLQAFGDREWCASILAALREGR